MPGRGKRATARAHTSLFGWVLNRQQIAAVSFAEASAEKFWGPFLGLQGEISPGRECGLLAVRGTAAGSKATALRQAVASGRAEASRSSSESTPDRSSISERHCAQEPAQAEGAIHS